MLTWATPRLECLGRLNGNVNSGFKLCIREVRTGRSWSKGGLEIERRVSYVVERRELGFYDNYLSFVCDFCDFGSYVALYSLLVA
jgi:hypothetical protein